MSSTLAKVCGSLLSNMAICSSLSCKVRTKKNPHTLETTAAVVMMTVLVIIFLRILTGIPGLGEGFDPIEPIGLGLVTAGYFTAFLFGALGGRHGAISEEEREDDD